VLLYEMRSSNQADMKFTTGHTYLKVAWAYTGTMLITGREDIMFKV